jgi:hypothetical protein
MSAPTRSRILLAWVVIVVTVIVVWKFIDYRNQPPMPPPAPTASDQ